MGRVRSASWLAPVLPLLLLGACGDDDTAPSEPRHDIAPTFVKEWNYDSYGFGEIGGAFALAMDSAGVIYAADGYTYKIQLFSRDGAAIGEWLGPSPGDSSYPWPSAIEVARDGTILVIRENAVLRFGADGSVLQSWGDSEEPRLYGPAGLAVDRDGNVYVADNGAHKIFKYSESGEFLINWPAGPPRDGRRHWGPLNLAVTPRGTLLMVEWHGYQVIEYSLEGDSLGQWGVIGIGSGQLHNIGGLAVDSRGDVYVSDYSYPRVLKFRADGSFLTQLAEQFDTEGGFLMPDRMAIFRNEELFVLDRKREKILKFVLN